jgi:hypothetical protein
MFKRAFLEQRRDARKPIDIVLNKYINGEPHLCCAVNVSRGGMLLRRVFEPDSLSHAVVLEFQLPGSERVLRAEGMALLGSPGGRSCGVRFTHMSSETFQVLEQFLGHSAPGPTPRHAVH